MLGVSHGFPFVTWVEAGRGGGSSNEDDLAVPRAKRVLYIITKFINIPLAKHSMLAVIQGVARELWECHFLENETTKALRETVRHLPIINESRKESSNTKEVLKLGAPAI